MKIWPFLRHSVLAVDGWLNGHFPRPKQMDLPVSIKTRRPQIKYTSLSAKTGPLILGSLYPLFPSALWTICYVSAHARGDTAWPYTLLAGMAFLSFLDRAIPALLMTFSESVRIGEIGKDDTYANDDVELAYRMHDQAKRRNIRMHLFERGGVLRAHFRDEDTAMLVRMAS